VAGGATISGAITPTDYTVRVQVCVAGQDFIVGDPDEDSNCRRYPDGNYKPTGLLHDYGESDAMLFGLITGSYQKNTEAACCASRWARSATRSTPRTAASWARTPASSRRSTG
jgi:hypothetical protein